MAVHFLAHVLSNGASLGLARDVSKDMLKDSSIILSSGSGVVHHQGSSKASSIAKAEQLADPSLASLFIYRATHFHVTLLLLSTSLRSYRRVEPLDIARALALRRLCSVVFKYGLVHFHFHFHMIHCSPFIDEHAFGC